MIEQLLDQLFEMQAALDVRRMHYYDLRQSVIPEDVRLKLAEINQEEKIAIESAQFGIDSLTGEIKNAVLAAGASIKGKHLQAVWVKGRTSWDTKALDGFAAAHPEIRVFRTEGAPSVAIRGAK